MPASFRGDFTEIPVIDLEPWWRGGRDRVALAHRVCYICHEVGFFVLVDHRVDPQLVDSVFSLSRRLFELPLEKKQLIDKRRSRHFRGWEAVGSEYTNNRPDIREQVDLWTEHPPRSPDVSPVYLRLLGPNQWLDDAVLPGFKGTMERWFEELGGLARTLLGVLSVGLGLAEGYFESIFGTEQMSLTKLIRYPSTPEGQFGVNPHHDAGFLTILAPGETAGLEVESPSGNWIPVPTVRNTFVINLGEMLQAMTGNYFVATPHRVFAREPRYSVGYFHGPSLETPLEPLAPLVANPRYRGAVAASPRHANAGFMARRSELQEGVGDMQSGYRASVYGEQLWNYFCRSYPDNVARHYPNASIG
ncbi:MAG TPA: 2-oxoglutarate and iron-dependent oxygenase domain-containing protein [Vicinamibacteria bacterium]|nr:2-oxoglutarate and iron-dependent oxygenase domain-containing protein [Vicinamibacteria bacterium]